MADDYVRPSRLRPRDVVVQVSLRVGNLSFSEVDVVKREFNSWKSGPFSQDTLDVVDVLRDVIEEVVGHEVEASGPWMEWRPQRGDRTSYPVVPRSDEEEGNAGI